MQRRTFLKVGAVGAATRERRDPACLAASGCRTDDAVRGWCAPVQLDTRGPAVTTYVHYPATGNPGGCPSTNAPVAPGVFPVCEFMHGYSSSPQNSLAIIRPLAEAGFIVPAPHFAHLAIGDVYNGEQSRDVSGLITRTLALNTGKDPMAGHIDVAAGVGVSGHSMGGMTTHGLLAAWPDPRITTAIPMSCVDRGNPSRTVRAKVLFMHGDRDDTTAIASARHAYAELPPTKTFLTFRGCGPQQLLRRRPDRQYLPRLDAMGPVRRHCRPRPPARRCAILLHHVGVGRGFDPAEFAAGDDAASREPGA